MICGCRSGWAVQGATHFVARYLFAHGFAKRLYVCCCADTKLVALWLYYQPSDLSGLSRNLSPGQAVSSGSYKSVMISHKLQEHQSPLADVKLPLPQAIIC